MNGDCPRCFILGIHPLNRHKFPWKKPPCPSYGINYLNPGAKVIRPGVRFPYLHLIEECRWARIRFQYSTHLESRILYPESSIIPTIFPPGIYFLLAENKDMAKLESILRSLMLISRARFVRMRV